MKTLELALPLPEARECPNCLDRLRESVVLVPGVDSARVASDAGRLVVSFDPDAVTPDRIEGAARDLGADLARRYAHATLELDGLDCADCAAKLEAAVGRMDGVLLASVGFATGKLRVEYDAGLTSREAVVATVRGLGYDVVGEDEATAREVVTELRVTGMDCADCAASIERNLAALAGVFAARVNFAAATLSVRHIPSMGVAEIVRVVEASGYGAEPMRARAGSRERPFWARNRRAVLTVTSGLALALGFAAEALGAESLGGLPLARTFFALAMLLGGYHVARAGLYGLIRSRTLDMNVLMTIAALGAIAIGEWSEGATVVFLFALGNTLEGYTMDRARGAIRALMALAPNEALVRRDGAEILVPTETVAVGEVVLVRPGERIPVDGRVTAGGSGVNQAPVTGESVPVEKEIGDEVYAGSIVESGYLEVEAARPYAENTVSRIVKLVEEAQSKRAPSQRFVDSFARYYTPAVIAGSVAIVAVPVLALGQPFDQWFYRALVLLVIACPCALVISTPVSIVSGIARAAALGVLVKGGSHLEEAGSLQVVAFDKTGTLTIGRPEVTDVVSLNHLSPEEVLHLTAAVEARSEHPLAAAVLRRRASDERDGRIGDADGHSHEVAEFEAVTGRGVRATMDGQTWYVGSPRLFTDQGVRLDGAEERVAALRSEGKTVLVLGTEEGPAGLVAVADRVRPGAKEAVAALKAAGVERVVVLTGDHEATARAIATAVGADEFRAGLLPEDKVAAVRELRERYGRVAMVGDGVNDAPALATSTVGIAMGAAGTDAALEAADVALMADDLGKVGVAIDLSRRALATIRQNVAFSLLVKVAFLAAASLGLVTLWLAILADTGASLIVTLNGMRLLRYGRGAGRADGRQLGTASAAGHAHYHRHDHAHADERSHECCDHEHDHEHDQGCCGGHQEPVFPVDPSLPKTRRRRA